MKRVTTISEVIIMLKQKYFSDGLFDLWKILDDYNIEVLEQDLLSHDFIGYLVHDEDDSWKIVTDTSLSSEKKRFLIFHMLGHYFLHKDSLNKEQARSELPLFLKKLDASYIKEFENEYEFIEEKEANQFASEVLIPKEKIDSILAQRKGVDSDLRRELARAFGVPLDAMYYRLNELGYEQ